MAPRVAHATRRGGILTSRERREFIVDLRRFRLAGMVLITIVTVAPSVLEMATQDLSPLVVLVRLVEAFALAGVLVAGLSTIALRYARIAPDDPEHGSLDDH